MTPVYSKTNLGQVVAFSYSWKWEIYSYSLRNPSEKISKPDTAMPSFRSRIPLRLLFYPSSQSVSNNVLFQRRPWIYRQQWQWQQNETRQLTRVEDPESWLSHQDKSSVSLAKHCHILFIKWSSITLYVWQNSVFSTTSSAPLRLCEWRQTRSLKPTPIVKSRVNWAWVARWAVVASSRISVIPYKRTMILRDYFF